MYGQTEWQFMQLVRLAWDLREIGRATHVELPSRAEPVLFLRGTYGAGRIGAAECGGRWVFTWGRGRRRRVAAYAEDAALACTRGRSCGVVRGLIRGRRRVLGR